MMMSSVTRYIPRLWKQVAIGRMTAGTFQLEQKNVKQYHSAPLKQMPISCGKVLRSNMLLQPLSWSFTSHQKLWGWLNTIFNKVDESRIKEVGPDRACAEWLLRCGALVKWRNMESWTKDYNNLPVSGGRLLKIEEIDATDSAIMHIGFPHFRGCKHIRRIVFHKSSYLDDAGLGQLPLLKDSLEELQVSSCGNVTEEGLRHLKQLKNLTYLLIYDLPEIRDKDAMCKELEEALPNCAVVFPYASAEDDPNLKDKA
ncbi:ATP synthase subunit s, mitochondrial-like isoform X1 [Penaeus japonicus]|nr:ATP synthase subunit s, mitochondrial-like isoform X1 [Penaeus japonicus]XP_042884883.1 ATP synthase subunit s, mitochondrial-like isoform X1 [Penaeus japonicus]XP_042884888.1 ATP synthase subunit s, mitochondrial-like isoform X1 [Penaeus japonicus]